MRTLQSAFYFISPFPETTGKRLVMSGEGKRRERVRFKFFFGGFLFSFFFSSRVGFLHFFFLKACFAIEKLTKHNPQTKTYINSVHS